TVVPFNERCVFLRHLSAGPLTLSDRLEHKPQTPGFVFDAPSSNVLADLAVDANRHLAAWRVAEFGDAGTVLRVTLCQPCVKRFGDGGIAAYYDEDGWNVVLAVALHEVLFPLEVRFAPALSQSNDRRGRV